MRNLTELSYKELIEVLEKNSGLYALAYDNYCESESEYINEIMQDIAKYCRIEYQYNDINYIVVRQCDYNDFLNSVLYSIHSYGFIGKYEDLVNRLLSRIDIFDENIKGFGDMSDKNFNLLEKWLDTGIETICNAIKHYINGFFDIDIESLADWLSCDISCNEYCWNDIDIDDNGIAYRTITTCLA